MNRTTQQIWLNECDGARRRWTITFGPLPDNQCGVTLFEKRTIIINQKLRSRKDIRGTLIHEAVHVATGQVCGEECAINVEGNASDLLDAVGV